MPSKSSSGSKKSGGSNWFARLFVLLLLTVIGLGVWYWWQLNDPSRKEPPVLANYIDVDRLKRSADIVTNVDWQGLSNRVATNLPWKSPAVTNPAVPPAVTNQVVRPAPPLMTNQVMRPAPAPIPANPYSSAASAPGVRPVQSGLEAQVALARLGFSPGSIDGVTGSQTRSALRAFQKRMGLPQTGELDSATRATLQFQPPLYTNYTVTYQDLSSLRQISKTWLGKSQQDHLGYESILELVAEKFQSHPGFIKQLNKSVVWEDVPAGTVLTVPNVWSPKPAGRAAYASILLSDRLLQVFDAQDRLMAQFPCSIAKHVDKRPIGVVRVKVAAENPNYRFDPKIFPESAEARQLDKSLMIPSGPNNPVGLAWVGLDKPGYGIHGTPAPELVGKTESHGCFRLANWNATYFLKLVWLGMPVYVEP